MPDDWLPDPEQGKQPSTSRSVILSAWLTGLVRRSLRTAPLHAIGAPTMGTGKSKLADIVAVILTGRAANVVSQGPTEEEMEKRLFAMLYSGDPVIVIDNIDRPLEGAAICSILTQEKWKGRILGKSETQDLPTNSLFLATGNNLTFRGDLTRRVVICRLDAREERPDDRKFDFDAVALARQNRAELVMAGLTILRAYIAAGRPLRGKVHDVGSFEDWTIIREALVWLDQPDPSATRSLVLVDDPIKQELAMVMDAWHKHYGTRSVTISQLKSSYDAAKRNGQPGTSETILVLGDILKDVSRKDEINAKSIGHWFKRHVDAIVNGCRFERSPGAGGDFSYRLCGGNLS